MILVDTSIWVDHLRNGLPDLKAALDRGLVLGHPWVTGELALASLTQRKHVLALLAQLPQAALATPAELLALIDSQQLMGTGIGYVDTQVLAGTLLTPDATLWTHDRHLVSAATRMGVAKQPGNEDVER